MTSLLPKPPPIIPNSKHRRRARGKASAPRRAAEVREEVRARMIRKVRVEEEMARKAAGTLEALASGLAITAAVPLLPIAQGNGVRLQIAAGFAASLGTITLIPNSVPEKGLTSRKRKRRRSQPPNPRRRVREVAEAARTKTITLWGKRIPTLITF